MRLGLQGLSLAVKPPGFASRARALYPDSTFVLDAENNAYGAAGLGYSALNALLAALSATVSRNTSRWVFNAAGVLTEVPANTVALDYDPVTLALRGIPFEPARTNQIRDNSTTAIITALVSQGLSTTFTAGAENGIPYIDARVFGTPSSSGLYQIALLGTSTAASSGQTWTVSAYLKLAAGALTNTSGHVLRLTEEASGSFLEVSEQSFTPSSGDLRTKRVAATRTFSNVSTSNTRARVGFNVTSGSAVDLTIRIGASQLEQGAFATSPIATSGSALTRDADQITFPGITGSTIDDEAAGLAAFSGGDLVIGPSATVQYLLRTVVYP